MPQDDSSRGLPSATSTFKELTATPELVYGRNPVREALRGPRSVHEVWATERATAHVPWLEQAPRHQVKPERALTEAAGTRDHQGVVAWCDPFRYADAYELARAETPLLVCLDQVTDPQNFGAVVRSAEGAGAMGVVVPAHRSARVKPAGPTSATRPIAAVSSASLRLPWW